MQVDPIKPKLKAPASMHLKLRCDGQVSNFAFKFKMRRYVEERIAMLVRGTSAVGEKSEQIARLTAELEVRYYYTCRP